MLLGELPYGQPDPGARSIGLQPSLIPLRATSLGSSLPADMGTQVPSGLLRAS